MYGYSYQLQESQRRVIINLREEGQSYVQGYCLSLWQAELLFSKYCDCLVCI